MTKFVGTFYFIVLTLMAIISAVFCMHQELCALFAAAGWLCLRAGETK